MSEYRSGFLPEDDALLLDSGAAAWEKLRDGRIYVSGGTGVIGRWLIGSLLLANRELNLGATVLLTSRNPAVFAELAPAIAADRAVTLIRRDVRDAVTLPEGTTHVIHAATDSSGKQSALTRLEMVDTIIGGTRNILDAATRAELRGLLYVSTGSVYGRSRLLSEGRIAETDRSGPLVTDREVDYDESKRMAEALAVIYHRERNVPAKIARCFAIVGPHLPLDRHFAVGNFIRDALAGGPVRVGGDGTPIRSYLYLADVAVWLWTILTCGATAHPFNVGSEEAVSVRDLAERVAAAVTPSAAVEIARAAAVDQEPSFFVPSTSRVQDELGLRRCVNLDEAIHRSIRWIGRQSFSDRATAPIL